ncbi:MAG: hypothetical protein IJU50_02010 [Lachnospiraceae bacterium]|nr:hypothetical protein [Lachnospiraceae bacterium]
MEANELTVAQLSKKLGFKSKTSLFRLLHGQSNEYSRDRFYHAIENELDEEWRARFRLALLTERIGAQRHALLQALDHCLFAKGEKAPSFIWLPQESGGTILILGCPWASVFSLADHWLAESTDTRVIHYFTRKELLASDELLPGLIGHIGALRYQAVLLDAEEAKPLPLTWNIVLHTVNQETQALLISENSGAWEHLNNGDAWLRALNSQLAQLPQTPLYRFDQLKSSSDYKVFTQQSYQMEYNRKTLIIKPTPGMQMMPADVVESTFIDYLIQNMEPVAMARESLIYTFEKRVKNFYACRKPRFLLLSVDAMLRFARTGLMDDQFFAFRPYTKGERVKVFKALQEFSRRAGVAFRFRAGDGWSVSAEVYEGFGALFYPSATNYNTTLGDYRELLLPGPEFADLLFQYAGELLFANPPEESVDDTFARFIREAEREEEK